MDQPKVHITINNWARALPLPFGISCSSDGDDYYSVSGEFIFSSGSTDGDSECVDVGIINDDVLELREFFTFALSSNDSAVDLCVPEADVYIIDEDGKCIYMQMLSV